LALRYLANDTEPKLKDRKPTVLGKGNFFDTLKPSANYKHHLF